MKSLRYGPVDNERPGLRDRDGRIHDLSGHVLDIPAETLASASLQMLRSLNAEALPLVHGVPRLAAPVARVGKCKGKPVGHEPRDALVKRTELAISHTITLEWASRL